MIHRLAVLIVFGFILSLTACGEQKDVRTCAELRARLGPIVADQVCKGNERHADLQNQT